MTVDRIRAAYEQARREQPSRPPPWETLPCALREALMRVYFAGRL